MKRLIALSVLSTLLLTACKASGDTIKIGFIGPLTGDAAALGKDILNGTQIAVEEVNANGGINGKQVQIITEDGRCSGSDATNAAQKLINIDHVVAIVGGSCSSETLAAAAVAESAKTIVMSPSASSPDITQAGEYIFRVYPSDAYKTTAIVKLFQERKYKKIALITENNDYAVAI
ncbi:ABC transporter substrate-binding protein, partial [Candidatus Peregrinibacteria bacterium]|nr:ABC transporter substrate-binding protein [Candidatus Peregrinibacteria bacterium]